jgi:hypothetical protein
LPACLLACLPACLLACLPACLLAWLPACLLACLPACLLACLPACLSIVAQQSCFTIITYYFLLIRNNSTNNSLAIVQVTKSINADVPCLFLTFKPRSNISSKDAILIIRNYQSMCEVRLKIKLNSV